MSQNEHELKPIVQIGKSGLTESTLKEIEKHLKKRKLIKIKCLKYFLDEYPGKNNKSKLDDICSILEEKLNCRTKHIGFNIILNKNGN